MIAADASGYVADPAQSAGARRPSSPTDLVPPHFPGTSGQQRHNKHHGGDAIARSDALGYPDSTQATDRVRLKQLKQPIVPSQCAQMTILCGRKREGKKDPITEIREIGEKTSSFF